MTVTFKAGSKVTHDANWVSFVKESPVFGAIHGAIKPGSLVRARVAVDHLPGRDVRVDLPPLRRGRRGPLRVPAPKRWDGLT